MAAWRAVPRGLTLPTSHHDVLVCWILIEDPCNLLTTLMIIIGDNQAIIRLHRHVFVILSLLFGSACDQVDGGCAILHYEVDRSTRAALVRN
jgi:hypothetical protein